MTTVQHGAAVTDVEDAYPLAALQAGMLFRSMYAERVATYHDVLTLTVRGRFDREALDAVLAELVSRHPVLRTSFDLTDFSEPVQLVHRNATLVTAVTDRRGVSATEADEQVAAWATEEQFRAYDLERPPLLRIAAHLLPGDRFALSISFHHAILDGWSAATLATELVRRYRARLDGRPLPVDQLPDSYVDFVAAEREAVASAEAESFWREIVVGSPPGRLPRMPGYPRGGVGASEHLHTVLDDGVAQGLRAVAARLGVPLRAVLLAAHLRVMSLVTGEPEVLTGTVTNGRPETDTSAEILGLFLNLVPVRLAVDQSSWAALILAVHDGYVRSLAHRRYPLFEMQRLADRSPLCDTSFDYRDFHVYQALGPSADSVEITGSSHLETTDVPFNAAFGRSADGGLALTISYDSTQFPVVQIGTIRGYYLTALAAIAADADGDPRPASPFLSADLVRMAAWNDTGTGPQPCPTLPAMVADWARRQPSAVAVVDGDGDLTYEQLWHRVCALADRLRERGVRTGSVVAVAVPRSADALVAMLAVLQAGGAVLPLDTDHPERRLRETIRSAGTMALVTRADVADKLTETDTRIAVDVASIAGPDGDTAPVAADPDSLAFVLFTSGSTGKPKGVMLSHRSAVAYSYGQAHRLGLHNGSRIALRSPLSVDSAVAEVVMAFGVGGALAVVPTEAVVDPDTFVATFTGYRITMAILVPSLIAPHVQAGTFARCPTLDVICSVGEALPRSLAEAFLAQCGARLFNLYGPTEAGIGLTEFPVRLDHPAGVVPIGGPTAGVTLHVLDASGQPVPIGTPGHLYAGGTQLALGYLGDPELTAAAFVPDHVSRRPGARLYRTGDIARWLPDGVVEFIGRADGQVKVRGVRVEPGEIEARLLEHPQVRQSVVQVYRVGERDVLTAHVVWSGDGTVADELRAFLADRLPRALIPTAYVAIEDLPVLPNGKVDRSALPEPTGTVGGYVPPRDHVEARLAARWEEILDVPMVGVFDDFFALGGHSLHALRLTMLIRRDFDREVPVAALLSAPTVAGLAAHLRAPDNLAPKVELVAFRDHGTRPPLFFMHPLGGQVFRYQKVARALGDDQPVYALPARGFLDGEQPHQTLAAMADDYAAYILRRYPHGPYLVGGMCVGGNIALEVARRLRRTGAEVPLVFAFWSHADNPVSPDQQDDATLMMYALAGSPFELDRASLAGRDADEQLLAIVTGAAQAGRLNPAATDIEQARRILRVYRANANALSGNKHEPYDGDVVLLKPVEAQEFAFEDDFSWREVVGDRLRILPIPGRQDTFADEPQATEVAAILKGLIDSVITGS